MRRLKVLQVGKFYPPVMGGMETHLENLCQELSHEVDLSVVVAATGRQTVDETVDGITVTRLGTRLQIAAAPVTPGLARCIRNSGADIVHLHLPHPAAVLSALTSGYRGRWLATYHSDIVRQRLLGRLYGPFRNAFLARCDRIIASSPPYFASSPVLQNHRERVRIIPFGIQLDAFSRVDSDEVAALRQKLGPRLVLSVGRLIYYKGFDVLIRAMRSVDGRLAIVGDGPLRGELERLAAELRVADRVSFLGEVRDVVPYFHAADLFALASVARSEAFAIVQVEAMACGRPVVNTALDSGVPFVSRHDETGLTVPPGDPDALAAALTRLLDDDALRERFAAAGRRRVEREFSRPVMGRRVLDLYREVCPDGAPAAGETAAPGDRPRDDGAASG